MSELWEVQVQAFVSEPWETQVQAFVGELWEVHVSELWETHVGEPWVQLEAQRQLQLEVQLQLWGWVGSWVYSNCLWAYRLFAFQGEPPFISNNIIIRSPFIHSP